MHLRLDYKNEVNLVYSILQIAKTLKKFNAVQKENTFFGLLCLYLKGLHSEAEKSEWLARWNIHYDAHTVNKLNQV